MGALITIEGGEYMGKTTLAIPGLESVSKRTGIPVLTSREPGGSPEAEQLRSEIFQKAETGASAIELATLFNKARKIHLEEVVKPFLGSHKDQNALCILDRYLDSTRVYQGLEAGLTMEQIKEMEAEYVGDYLPDITIILSIPEQKFARLLLARQQLAKDTNHDNNIWDNATIEKHLLRQRHYLSLPKLAAEWGERRGFAIIDVSQHPFQIIRAIVEAVGHYIDQHHLLTISSVQKKMLNSWNELIKEPSWIYLEKAWKKQEHIMRSL
ncbi:MAG: dTMP kinase [Patescibacteria group bacterium]